VVHHRLKTDAIWVVFCLYLTTLKYIRIEINKTQMSLKPVRMTVTIKLDSTLWPITLIEFTNSLEKLGFEITEEIPIPRPIGRFSGLGQIARKGNIVVNVDGGAKAISMYGLSLESTIEEFDSFIKTLQTDYSVDLDEFADYYQFASRYEYKTNEDAYAMISNFFTYPKLDELAKIIDIPIKTFSIKVGSADAVPNEINWFDIQFAPDVQRNDGYTIDVVYRNENKESYRTFISHIEEKIVKSIQLLEG